MKPKRHLAAPSLFMLLAIAAAVAMSSCRTTAGLGRDIQHVGNEIGNAADRAR